MGNQQAIKSPLPTGHWYDRNGKRLRGGDTVLCSQDGGYYMKLRYGVSGLLTRHPDSFFNVPVTEGDKSHKYWTIV